MSGRALAALPRVLVLGIALGAAGAGAASLDEARRLAEGGAVSEALAEVDAFIAAQPGDVAAGLLRGVLLSRAGRSDDAIAQFTAIARQHPRLPEPHNNLAVLYAAQGRYDEARDALLEAIRREPDYDVAHENLGDVYAKLAALSYGRAHRINPDNADAADKAAAAEALLDGERDDPREAHVPPAPAARANVRPAGDVDAASAAPGPTTPRCVRVPALSPPALADTVAGWLRRNDMQVTVTAAAVDGGYRVYVPPLPDVAAARARVAELRAAGVRDLIVITEGPLRNGISLGVYKGRDGAERRLQNLATLGITAQMQVRGDAAAHAVVQARGPFDATAFARAFPDVGFDSRDCP